MDSKSIRAKFDDYVSNARRIARTAEQADRPMTEDERSAVEVYVHKAAALKDILGEASNADVDNALRTLSSGAVGTGDLYSAFKSAGWTPGNKVAVPAQVAFKTVTFDTGDLDAVGRDRFAGAALGADRRKVYEVFPTVPVDAGTTSVEVFRQQSRTLASSDYQYLHRPIDSTGLKQETSSVLELVQTSMQMVATVQSGVPNVVLLQDGARSIVNADLLLSYQRGLEDLISDAFNATSIGTGSGGTDLTSAALYARKDMAANGYNGTVLVVNPTDFITAALKKGTSEVYARPDPLQTFELVQAPLFASGTAYLVDPQAAGRLYLSGVSLASFEENFGRTNSQTVRLEGSALFTIERSAAIVKLASTS
jgi:hypothetical protein